VKGDDGIFLTPPSFFTHFPYLEVLRRAELGVFPYTTIHHAQYILGKALLANIHSTVQKIQFQQPLESELEIT
jgi:hypothetical protein